MPKKRIPIAGSYNTRNSEVTALSSSSGVVGVGIVGSMIVGQAFRSSDKDNRFINCFSMSVVNQATQTKTLYLVKRPGFVASLTPAAGSVGSAIHVWSGQGSSDKIISAFGAVNSTIYDSSSSLGAITGKCNGISETLLGSTAYLTLSSSDSTGWIYSTGGGLVKISDGQFPGNAGKVTAGNFVHLDGFCFIMDTDGNVWNSDLNSITSWTSSGYYPALTYPDKGVGLARFKRYIIAFKKESFEVLENVGNAAGSPLTKVDFQLVGCTSSDAITQIKDTVFFAGADKAGVICIYKYEGGKPEAVSTPEIATQLTVAGPANVSLTSIGFYGKHFVIAKASNTTFVYCLEEGNWHEWTSTTPLWYKVHAVSNGATLACYSISDVSTSGKVFAFNPASATYQDNGVAYTATAQVGPLDMGSRNRKFWESLAVIGDQQTSASDLSVVWSDDDFQTYSSPRTLDLTTSSPIMYRCGSSRSRSFIFTHSANTPLRLQAMELEFSVGNN